jgi:hypothetical protein
MHARQKGITFIGWLFLLVPVAIVGYSGIRVAPKYMTYFKVVKAIEQTATEFAGEETINQAAVRSSLEHRFDIDSIESPSFQEIDIHREGEHWVIGADYEEVAPLFGAISLLIKFKTASTVG